MNNFMPPSMANESPRPIADEAPPSSVPPAWRILAAVSDARRKRAAYALAQTKQALRHANARQAQAETEAARLQALAIAFEREWHCKERQREANGTEIRHARAAQGQRQALADRQMALVRMCEQDSVRARRLLDQARERHARLARKHEKMLSFRLRIAKGGDA